MHLAIGSLPNSRRLQEEATWTLFTELTLAIPAKMDVEHEQTSFHRFEVDDSRPASTTNTDFDPHSPSDIIPLLPPVDRGKDAWLFLAGATTVEVLVWGLPFSVGVLREYWSRELFPTEVYHGDTMLTLAATL